MLTTTAFQFRRPQILTQLMVAAIVAQVSSVSSYLLAFKSSSFAARAPRVGAGVGRGPCAFRPRLASTTPSSQEGVPIIMGSSFHDPSSQSNFPEATVTHVDFDLRVDFDAKEIVGACLVLCSASARPPTPR